MDNATLHKNKLLQNEIKEDGHIIEYLPPYLKQFHILDLLSFRSLVFLPDLNTIEHKWAQAKSRKKHFCDIDVLFRDCCT